MTRPTLAELEALLSMEFIDHQVEALEAWAAQEGVQQRLCLYHRTGAGKSVTALACVALSGHDAALVVAPPSTHPAWRELGATLGIEVRAISHARFRQSGFLVSRTTAVIADEFHLFGGHDGKGWKKLDRLARGLQAPLILASATPNYNDAERVYCIQHILDPKSVAGGFLQFLYTKCTTEENPFGRVPLVTGFQNYPDAEHYLAALPNVMYLPDNASTPIVDIELTTPLPAEFETYGLSRRKGRIMASQMEARHTKAYDLLIDSDGMIRDHVMDMLEQLAGEATTPVLVFCNSSKIAVALKDSLLLDGVNVGLVTGADTQAVKEHTLDWFRRGDLDMLIGTATLATGTDGLDKVCDTLVIVNDTDDNALRRQLVGRILPRGLDVDASGKHVYRFVMDS